MKGTRLIYLVDDDMEDRMLLSEALTEIDPNIRVVEAENGEALLKIIQDPKPSDQILIILDMNMPRMNGLETLENLRSTPIFTNIPVAVVSTSGHIEMTLHAQKLGALACFVKPSSIASYLDLAGRLISLLN